MIQIKTERVSLISPFAYMGISLVRRNIAPGGPPEHDAPPVCSRTKRCGGCPYPGHGFICWGENGKCLRSRIAEIHHIKQEDNEDASDPLQ